MLPKNSVIVDAGFWVALHNRRDSFHNAALHALDQFETSTFITTWPVLTETSHLLFGRVGIDAQMVFLDRIDRGGADIFHLTEAGDMQRVLELMFKYRDLPMDLADASLVILAEALGHGRVLSTDQRDFNAYRWKSHEPFDNLLIPAAQ